MRRAIALAVVCAALVVPGAARADTPAQLVAGVQRIADAAVAAQPTVPGAIVDVEAPRRRVSLTVSAGSATLPRAAPLAPDATFRYASNTKTYVAAAVMRLVEERRLALSDPIAALLPPSLARIVPRAHTITVDMLLHHTSGLYDYASDPHFEAAVLANPAHHWTRIEQVRWALSHGHPYGRPGRVFTYSDTGYILLGAIIERATGRPLGDALPALLRFRRLGLTSTWLEDGRPGPPPVAARQHQYFGTADLTGADPSFDLYGGGGLIGTARDLGRFWDALFAGRVVSRASLRELERIPPPARREGGGAGLYRASVGGRTVWFHAGFWSTIAVTDPSRRLTAVVSMGQAQVGQAVLRLALDVFDYAARTSASMVVAPRARATETRWWPSRTA